MSPLLKNKLKSTSDKAVLTRYCIISGVLAAVMMLFVYAAHNNTLTGGDLTVLRMDLYHQYGPLFSELYDRVKNGYSLAYSWTSGLGSSFTGNLLNYCASPFALIIMLTGHKNMPEAIALMILCKAVFSSTSFTYYINKTNNHVRKESIAFGLLYAFCGYFVAYSWNVMWLDAMAVFPLVILGIERIIQKNRPGLYIFALTYTMVTNYYMAYMVCILSVLYFCYFFFGRYKISDRIASKKVLPAEIVPADKISAVTEPVETVTEPVNSAAVNTAETEETVTAIPEITAEDVTAIPGTAADTVPEPVNATADTPDEVVPASQTEPVPATTEKKKKRSKPEGGLMNNRFWRTGMTFALCSVLCFFISAICLIPVAYCLQSSSATSGTFPENIKYYFNLFDFIANHLPAVETTIRSSGDVVLPNVYCGMLTVLLIPMYFMNSEIPGRKKVMAVLMIGMFYLSFSINYLNFIWHGFHMPNDLPYRYSFAYSFILLTIAYQAYIHIQSLTKKTVVGVGIVALLFVVFIQELGSKNTDTQTINISIVCILAYCLFLGILLSKRSRKKMMSMMLSVLTLCELILADTSHIVMAQPKADYVSDYTDYQTLKETVEGDDDTLFYRTELSKLRTRMDPSWYGYNGVSVFSSMAYEGTSKLMKALGMFGNNINSYTYYPQTTVFNSMFGIKYIYDNENLINNDEIYTLEGANDSFTAYEYNYYLPLAYSVSDDVANWNATTLDASNPQTTPFDNQNSLIKAATGIDEDVLEKVNATDVSTTNLASLSIDSINYGRTFSVSKAGSGDATCTVTIDVEESGNYYVYVGSTSLSDVSVNADDFSYTYVASAIQPFTLDVGYQPAGAQITVKYTVAEDNDSGTISFCAAKLNEDVWEEAYEKLNSNTFNMTSFEETEIEGTVTAPDDNSMLFTSIPYDESWEITVDGKVLSYPVESLSGTDEDSTGAVSGSNISADGLVKVSGGLLGIELSAGEHTISFKYKTRGVSEGAVLTLLGLAALAAMFVWNFIIKKKNLLSKFRPLLFEDITEWVD